MRLLPQNTGTMQVYYEHALLKQNKVKSRRSVLIFRNGEFTCVPADSGKSVASLVKGKNLLEPVKKQTRINFGHVSAIKEGQTYSRTDLLQTSAHS